MNYLNDLPELTNIIHNIIPENIIISENNFTEEDFMEMYESCFHIMEEFIENNPTIITEPDFENIFDENIYELMCSTFEDIDEEYIETIIEQAKNDFYITIMPPRSYPETIILVEPQYDELTKQINYLRSKPQPQQRTKEWYEFRRNLITASNAYKAFESESTRNQLIYEKCVTEINDNNNTNDDVTDNVKQISITKMVNVNSTLHWGQKYEPVSVQLYETIYNTKIEDFGCIQDDNYKFLGASPDGINIDPNSPRYGRMLEIKNVVNREINGIPKKEYWVQMQMQMNVCKLNECDFLETQFKEYENSNDYWNDNSDKRKGVIMYFHTKEGSPYYEYMPLELVSYEEVNKWQEEMIDKYQNEPYNYIWIKDYYWKLEQMSCVLVVRNEKWFNDNINTLVELWNIIEKERITGYEHRSPKKRIKKEVETQDVKNQDIRCLLKPIVTNNTNINNTNINNTNINNTNINNTNNNTNINNTNINNTNNNTKFIYIDTSNI
jgi:putative phage-type endonuclease